MVLSAVTLGPCVLGLAPGQAAVSVCACSAKGPVWAECTGECSIVAILGPGLPGITCGQGKCCFSPDWVSCKSALGNGGYSWSNKLRALPDAGGLSSSVQGQGAMGEQGVCIEAMACPLAA